MRPMRAIGYAGALLLVLVAWKGHGARKEYVRLTVTTESGPARVRVVTRGLILISPRSAPGRQPWQVITTLSTPGVVALGGVGEADIRPVDSTSTLVVDVTQVREQAPKPERFTGEGFRVSRSSYTEPFLVTALSRAAAGSIK